MDSSLLHFTPTPPEEKPSVKPKSKSKDRSHYILWTGVACLVLGFGLGIATMLAVPPSDFPKGEIVHVEEGWSAAETAEYLQRKGIIKSAWLFKVLSFITGNQTNLIAGYYLLDTKPSSFEIFNRLVLGDYHLVPIKVKIPEGATAEEVRLIVKKLLPFVDQNRLAELTKDAEGFLFPDTYFFLPNTSAEEVVRAMKNNFQAKLEPFKEEIEESGRTIEEVITMASILEEEANTPDSKKLISGILWKRIKKGMPLQVDAVFPYIIGKNTFQLTLDDLRIDSPYNTYRYKGLPPGPISNPGLESIKAALSPKSSPYWFYLSDMQGKMHYAADYKQHIRNKDRYLP